MRKNMELDKRRFSGSCIKYLYETRMDFHFIEFACMVYVSYDLHYNSVGFARDGYFYHE